jgi:hypothetical protein
MSNQKQELPQELVDRFPEFIDKWIKIGLNTDKCNFEESKKQICKIYKILGNSKPKHFYHAKSPIGGIVLSLFVKHLKGKGITPDNTPGLEEKVSKIVAKNSKKFITLGREV